MFNISNYFLDRFLEQLGLWLICFQSFCYVSASVKIKQKLNHLQNLLFKPVTSFILFKHSHVGFHFGQHTGIKKINKKPFESKKVKNKVNIFPDCKPKQYFSPKHVSKQ